MNDITTGIIQWIKDDYRTHPIRCCLEIFAWILSICCSVTMAATVPNPPLIILYPIFISQCAIFAWAALSRKSFGMLANYCLLVSIDIVGLIRMVIN